MIRRIWKVLFGHIGSEDWPIIIAMAIGLLMVFAVNAWPQEPPKGVTFKELIEDDGYTFCYKGKVQSMIAVDLPAVGVAVVTAHELVHQAQYKRWHNDCAAFAAYYATPVGLLNSEAEAYAADLCVAVTLGADKLTRGHDYAERISHYMGGEVNLLDAIQALRKYDKCPTTSNLVQ